MNPLTDDGDDTEPTSFLVEFTPDQMRAFWEITNAYEEDTFGRWDERFSPELADYRAELRSVQAAVSSARPIWD